MLLWKTMRWKATPCLENKGLISQTSCVQIIACDDALVFHVKCVHLWWMVFNHVPIYSSRKLCVWMVERLNKILSQYFRQIMLSFSLLEDYAPIMPADCCQVVDGYWMMKYHLIQRKALMQTNGVQIVSSDVVVRSWFAMTSPPLQTNGVQTVTSHFVVRLSKRASVTRKA